MKIITGNANVVILGLYNDMIKERTSINKPMLGKLFIEYPPNTIIKYRLRIINAIFIVLFLLKNSLILFSFGLLRNLILFYIHLQEEIE